jgi:hypothetical protein
MFDAISFVLEILAVFLGVLAAFWLDNYRERRVETSGAVRALRMIHEELIGNMTIMEQLQQGFSSESDKVPYFGPQFALWRGVSDKIGLTKNDTLFRELLKIYYRFEVLDSILSLYREHYAMLGTGTGAKIRRVLEKRVATHKSNALVQLGELIPQTKSLITAIEAEIERLS